MNGSNDLCDHLLRFEFFVAETCRTTDVNSDDTQETGTTTAKVEYMRRAWLEIANDFLLGIKN